MGFPVTINGNTYLESDFSPYGYTTAFPAIINDIAAAIASINAGMAASANIAVNPAMDVSQELGTTGLTLATATQKYILDQWQAFYQHIANTAVITAKQLAAASFPAPLAGFPFGFQLKATTALSAPGNSDFANQRTFFEGTQIAHLGFGAAGAQSLSYGFWYYSTIAGVVLVLIQNHNATRNYYIEHTLAAGWNWCSATVPGDTSGTWLTTTSTGMAFLVIAGGKAASPVTAGSWGATQAMQSVNSTNLLASNNNQVILTGVVIVPGIVAPTYPQAPAMMRPFDVERARCKRWWEKSYGYADVPGTAAAAGPVVKGVPSNTIVASQLYGSTPMSPKRVLPTVVLYGYSGTTSTVSDTSGTDLAAVSGAATGIGENVFDSLNASGGSITTIGNDVLFHWTASARM